MAFKLAKDVEEDLEALSALQSGRDRNEILRDLFRREFVRLRIQPETTVTLFPPKTLAKRTGKRAPWGGIEMRRPHPKSL